jgi:hypothetical protein
MFLLCYAQCLSYLFHIVLPFLGILQHYVEFDIRTIAMLEKLVGARFFGGSIGHLACCHATFLASSGGLNLPFMV